MHKKQLYEAPDAELLVIRYEEAFLTGTTGIEGSTVTDPVGDDWDDEGND